MLGNCGGGVCACDSVTRAIMATVAARPLMPIVLFIRYLPVWSRHSGACRDECPSHIRVRASSAWAAGQVQPRRFRGREWPRTGRRCRPSSRAALSEIVDGAAWLGGNQEMEQAGECVLGYNRAADG